MNRPLLRIPVFPRCDGGIPIAVMYRTALVIKGVVGEYLGEAVDASAVGLGEDVCGGEGVFVVVPEGGGVGFRRGGECFFWEGCFGG